MNVGLATIRSARRYGTRTAIFHGNRRWTWRELDDRSNRIAHLLRDGYGLEHGDRVALLAPNRPEVAEILAGISKAGCTYVGLNFRLTLDELQFIMDNAEPRVLIVAGEFREMAQAVLGRRSLTLLDIDDTGPAGYAASLRAGSPLVPHSVHTVRPEDDFCIHYTSGTTGTPKGVWFDHRRALQHATVAALEYDIRLESRYLVSIPHNSSLHIALIPCMTMGAALGFFDNRGFEAERFGAEVVRTKATHSFLVPTQMYRLLEGSANMDLSPLEHLGYGSAPMAPDKAAMLVERFGFIFSQLYGMAEIASIGTMLRKHDFVSAVEHNEKLFGSVGQPSYAIDARIVNRQSEDVSAGNRGEVIFGGPYIMKGYFRDPLRTAKTLVDGWIHSGDIAEYDEDGYMYIVDRKKDIIIRGGHNVSSAAVEAVLHRHPAVREVGVVGVPDAEWGESILAVVALSTEARISREELLRWCREESGLGSIRCPQGVVFVDALPKNAVGKISKRALRGSYSLPVSGR